MGTKNEVLFLYLFVCVLKKKKRKKKSNEAKNFSGYFFFFPSTFFFFFFYFSSFGFLEDEEEARNETFLKRWPSCNLFIFFVLFLFEFLAPHFVERERGGGLFKRDEQYPFFFNFYINGFLNVFKKI